MTDSSQPNAKVLFRGVDDDGGADVETLWATHLGAETGNVSDQLLQGLVALGCNDEGANKKYISVNIPPGVELDVVRAYLIEHDATWEHADPTYEALNPPDA